MAMPNMATPDIKGLSINDATGHIQTQYRGYNAVYSEKESYGPSLKTLDSLVPMKVSELVAGQRHAGRRLRLRTLSTTYGKGVYLTCRGDEDILVWSLVSYPFGRTSTTLPVGTLIEIREPAFHKAENGRLAICVWHPTDMFFCLQYILVGHASDHVACAIPNMLDCMGFGNAALLKNAPLAAAHFYRCARVSAENAADHDKAMVKEAFAYIRCNHYGDALQTLSTTKAATPGNGAQLLRLIYAALTRMEDWGLAHRKARELETIDPDSTRQLGLVPETQKRLDEHLLGDYDIDGLVQKADRAITIHDIADYAAGIEQRTGALSGIGLFLKSSAFPGSLLLVEKAFALTQPGEHAGSENLRPTNPRHPAIKNRLMTLLDKLADKAVTEPAHLRDLFSLCSGARDGPPIKVSETPTFETDRAQRIHIRNAHSPFVGACHVQHDVFDPSCPDEHVIKWPFKPEQQCLGIWLEGSRFDHSCVPNAQWSWISNVMVVRAARPLAADEELTISYVPPNQTFDERLKSLADNGFVCHCPLCEAECELTLTQISSRRILDKLDIRIANLPSLDLAKHSKTTLRTFHNHLHLAYPSKLYADQALPAPCLSGPLLNLAHMTLGPSIPAWNRASASARAKASTYLHACLSLALQVHIAYAKSSSYCEIIYDPHSCARFVSIHTLIALAELAHLSPDPKEKARCPSLKYCAKAMYLICYGESVSFQRKHQAYACKDVKPENGKKPGEEKWVKCVKEAEEKGKAAWEFCKSEK